MSPSGSSVRSRLAALLAGSWLLLAGGAGRASSPPPCPAGPHGLFVHAPNLPVEARHAAGIQGIILRHPTVAGANIVVPWSAVDRGPGANPRYDWTFVEEAVRPWLQAGKRIGFLVWAVAEGSAQEFGGASMTPAYVLEQAPSVYDPAKPQVPRTPVYWEPACRDNYKAFLAAFAARYGSQPWVSYIRFGIGYGAEDYVQNDYDLPPLRGQWAAQGLSEAVWTQYSLDMLDFIGGLKCRAQLMVTINNFKFDNSGGINRLPAAVAARAAQLGVGFGTQGLSKYDLRQEQELLDGVPGPKGTADWLRLFDQHAGKVPLEVQTMAWSAPNDSGRIGSLGPLVALALRHQAQILELYPAEWLVAYDPSNPAYPAHHAEYAQVLEDAAALLD
jgi:hypothetical protein